MALAPHSSSVCMSGCMFSNNVSRYAGATLNLSASSQAYLSGRGHLTPLDQSGRLLLNSYFPTTHVRVVTDRDDIETSLLVNVAQVLGPPDDQ